MGLESTTTRLRSAPRGGILLIAAAAVLWGTVGVTTRSIYELAPTNPLSVGFFRMALAAPALLAAAAAALGQRAWRITRRDAGLAVLIGVLLGLYQACFFTAITYVGVAVSSLVTLCTAPVMTAVMAALLTRERLTRRAAGALACALAGTALLVGLRPDGAGAAGALMGVLFALGSGLGYAGVAVCGRVLSAEAHPLQVNSIAFSSGALLLLALALPTGFVASYPAAGWGMLLYLGLVPSALGYGLFLMGMRTTAATEATIVTLLEPLTATLLAWLLFGERLAPLGALGALLLLAAMALLYRGD